MNTSSLISRLSNAALRPRFVKLALAASVLAAALGGNAQAQTWVGNTSTNWGTSSNWTTTPGNGSTLTFGAAGSAGTTLTDNFNGSPYYFAGLTFNAGAASYTINPSSANPYIELVNFGGTGNITDNSTNTETVNVKVTMYNGGSGNFNVASTGTLVLGGGLSVSTPDNGTQTTATIDGNANVGGTVDFSGGTVTLTGLTVGSGTSGNGSNWITSSTALFNGATFNDSGNVTLGGSQLVIASGTTANVTGNITTNNDWASLLMTGGSLTTANVTLTGRGASGQVVLDGGTLTTGSISAIDWEYTANQQESLAVFNGTQINSSASSSTFISVTPGSLGAFAGTSANVAYIGTGGLLLNTAGYNDTIATKLVDLTTTQTANDDALSAGMAGPGILTKSGTGTLTLSGANTYSGATTVSAGTLNITGSLGATAVSVASGATLTGAGTTSTTGVIGGAVTVAGGGALNLTAGNSSDFLTVKGLTLGSAGAYGAANYATLNYTVSSNGIEGLTIGTFGNGNATLTLNSGGAYVDVTGLGVSGSYTLATYGSQVGSGFSLSSTTPGVTSIQVGPLTYTLVDGTNSLVLQISGGGTPPAVAYWYGGAGSTVWNGVSGATTNWSTNLAGTTDAGLPPSAVTDVFLNANNQTGTVATTLGSNTTINTLNVNGNGTNTINAGSTLTINALADTGNSTPGTNATAGAGINIGSGANAFTINAPIVLGSIAGASSSIGLNQTWTNASANTFTIGGSVTGTAATGTQTLTFADTGAGATQVGGIIGDGTNGGKLAVAVNSSGSGVVTLSGVDTYTGGTTVVAGTLQMGNASALGSTSAPLTVGTTSATATLDLDGNNLTVGSLSGSTGGVITSTATGNLALTDNIQGGGTSTYAGSIQNGSATSVALNLSGTGTLVLSGSNSFTGFTSLNGPYGGGQNNINPTLQLANANALAGSALGLRGNNGTAVTDTLQLRGNGNTTFNMGSSTVAPSLNNGVPAVPAYNIFLDNYNTVSNTFTFDVGAAAGGSAGVMTVGTVDFSNYSGSPGTQAILNATNSSGDGSGLAITAIQSSNLNGYNGSGQIGSLLTISSSISNANGFTIGSFTGSNFQASTLTLTGTGNTTFTGAVNNGTGQTLSLIKTGTGTVTLNGASNYSGGTTLTAGTIKTGNAAALGGATATLLMNGGTLDLDGTDVAVGNFSGTSGVVTSSAGASGASILTVNNPGSAQTYAGAIDDGASNVGLTLGAGDIGSLTLSGSNNYSGGTTVSGGTLIAGSNSAFGTGTVVLGDANTQSATPTVLTGGAYTVGANLTVTNHASLATIGGGTDNNSTFSGLITTDAGGETGLTFSQVANTGSNALTLSGGIQGGSFGGQVTFAGPGNINVTAPITDGGGLISVDVTGGNTTFGAVNTYSGTTYVDGGTLTLATSNAIGSESDVTVGYTTNGTLAMGNNDDTVDSLTLGGDAEVGTVTGTGTLTTALDYNLYNGSISASLAGDVSVIKRGDNTTVVLTGDNSYTGDGFYAGTEIVSGTVQVGNGGSTGSLGGGGVDIGGLSGDPTTVLAYDRSDTALVESNTITGLGSVQQIGTGATTLTGDNTYSGGTTISAGTLYVNNTSGSGTGSGSVLVQSGGTLAGSGTISGAVTVQSGGKLASGPAQTNVVSPSNAGGVDTVSGPGLTADLAVNGGATLQFDLGAGADTNATPGVPDYANPNLNSTSLTSTGPVMFGTTGGNVNVSLVDLTAFSLTDTLQLRYQNPYLLISAGGLDSNYNLVTTGGYDQDGLVLGIGSAETGTQILNSFTLSAQDINGGNLAIPYNNLQLYLYEGNLEVIPEPGTWALMLGGLALLVLIQRRRRDGTQP